MPYSFCCLVYGGAGLVNHGPPPRRSPSPSRSAAAGTAGRYRRWRARATLFRPPPAAGAGRAVQDQAHHQAHAPYVGRPSRRSAPAAAGPPAAARPWRRHSPAGLLLRWSRSPPGPPRRPAACRRRWWRGGPAGRRPTSSGVAAMAPMGNPPPRPLAREMASGRIPLCLVPEPLRRSGPCRTAPRRRAAGCPARRTGPAGPAGSPGRPARTPPSPCTASTRTATVRSFDRRPHRVQVVERHVHKTVGQRLETLLAPCPARWRSGWPGSGRGTSSAC